MDLLDTGKWFRELPPDKQREIQAARAKVPVADSLIPKDHGPNRDAHLEAGKKRFLAAKGPFCMVRIGDCELGLLGAGYLPSARLKDLAWHQKLAGFDNRALRFRKDFVSAVRESEIVGLHGMWAEARQDTAVVLSLCGIPVPLPNGVDVHLPYKLLVDGTLVQFLLGKKILLIGALAPKFASLLKVPAFLSAHHQFGHLGKLEISGVIKTRSRQEPGGASVDYEKILGEASKIPFDVALLSCGVTAKPLAWRIWKTGKTALDIGFVFDALLGDDERRLRPVLKKVSWSGLRYC